MRAQDDDAEDGVSETIGERPVDGDIRPGAVSRDLDGVTTADSPDIELEGAMATGEDEGTPGERADVDPGDVITAATEDDAPLSDGEPGASSGGAQDDGLTAQFSEPTD